jgi:hypothetical protein
MVGYFGFVVCIISPRAPKNNPPLRAAQDNRLRLRRRHSRYTHARRLITTSTESIPVSVGQDDGTWSVISVSLCVLSIVSTHSGASNPGPLDTAIHQRRLRLKDHAGRARTRHL